MKRNSSFSASDGFSLIISLIILVLLSILVVSFITTATLERTTARAFANKAAAEIAAETATNQAISLLTERVTLHPDSATVWEALNPQASVGGYGFEGTVLYYTKHATDSDPNGNDSEDPNLAPVPSTNSPQLPPTYMLPLVSRGNIPNDPNALPIVGDTLITNHANALGTKGDSTTDPTNDKWTDDNSLDLNRPRSNTDTTGWIGTKPDGRLPYRARWVEIHGTPSGATSASPGKTISRYAFWVEDESFRVNLNLLDNNLAAANANTARGSEITENARIDKTKSLPPQIVGLLPIQGLLRSVRAPMDTPSTDINSWAGSVRSVRNGWFGAQLFELRGFNHASLPYTDPSSHKPVNYPLGDGAKFLATIYSGGLNMSRNGSQRVNLNGLGFDKDISAVTDGEITKQIGQVVQTIKYHAPQFGQRFYRDQDPYPYTLAPVTPAKQQQYAAIINKANVVNATDADTYLYKVAATIRDYIDPDNRPTLILAPTTPGGQPSVAPRVKPSGAMFADDSDNIYWAQGKDGAPFIQEVVARYRTTCSSTPSKTYDLRTDYYVEVWNMSNKDILAKDLNHPFLQIGDSPGWHGHLTASGVGDPLTATNNTPVAGDPFENRPFTVDLLNGVKLGTAAGGPAPDGVVFKAGACTVISTDPDGLPAGGGASPTASSAGGFNAANTYYCGTILTGKRQFTGPYPSNCNGIWMLWRDAGGASDYGTAAILGNDYGYIDCAPYAVAHNNSSGSAHVTYGKSTDGATSLDEVFGGSLIGNTNTASQLGDPRTNNEQLKFQRYKTGGVAAEPDVTRYPNSGTDGYRFTLGWPNANFTNPYLSTTTIFPWKDYYKVWTQVSPGPFNSVPNPTADTAPAFIANENLKSIGQLGDIFDPARVLGAKGTLGIRYSRGGGRTFKIGQKDDLADTSAANAYSQQWAAWRLTDFFDTSNEIYQPGLININGVRRDNGAALRAACYGLTLKTVSQASTASTPTVTAANALDSVENDTTGIQVLVNQAIARLNNDPSAAKPLPSYFRERGELADLSLYTDTVSTNGLLSGTKMAETFDHSREELFRRLAGMITTRGNVFSVYAVGQSITVGTNGKNVVTGEHWVKTTFALLPKKKDGTDFQVTQETFIPDDATSRATRFAKPDHYDIQLLQVSSP